MYKINNPCNQYVEKTAAAVLSAPRLALENLRRIEFALCKAKATTEGIGGVSCDSTKVQGGQGRDLADIVSGSLYIEEAEDGARNLYNCAVYSLRYVLERAVLAGAFSEEQAQLWKDYYETEKNLQEIADRHGITKDRAKYLIRKKRALAGFCRAVATLEEGKNYEYIIERGI